MSQNGYGPILLLAQVHELGVAQLISLALGIVFHNVSGVGVVPSLMCHIVHVTVVHLAVGFLVL